MRIRSAKEQVAHAAVVFREKLAKQKAHAYTGADKPGGRAAQRRLKQQESLKK